jgi:hypothetical protein
MNSLERPVEPDLDKDFPDKLQKPVIPHTRPTRTVFRPSNTEFAAGRR